MADSGGTTPIEQSKLDFEKQKWADEVALRQRDLNLRETQKSPWSSPLLIAILTAAAAGVANAIVSQVNASNQIEIERLKAEQSMILEMIKTSDVNKAASNLKFLVDTGLVTDEERAKSIQAYLAKNATNPGALPSLPSASGASDPRTSVTARVKALQAGPGCTPAAGNVFCVAGGVLVDSAGKPVPVVDGNRRGVMPEPPIAIVMHFTAGPDGAARRAFVDPSRPGSAHLEINRDGSLTQFVPFDVGANHAGISEFEGVKGLNSRTIGIEFANYGRLDVMGAKVPVSRTITINGVKWESFTEPQLRRAEEVVKALLKTYPSIRGIVGHNEVTRPAGRKIDPGPAFPMARFKTLLAPNG